MDDLGLAVVVDVGIVAHLLSHGALHIQVHPLEHMVAGGTHGDQLAVLGVAQCPHSRQLAGDLVTAAALPLGQLPQLDAQLGGTQPGGSVQSLAVGAQGAAGKIAVVHQISVLSFMGLYR